MRFLVISGTGWVAAQIATEQQTNAVFADAKVKIEEECDSLEAANDRARAIAIERGLA